MLYCQNKCFFHLNDKAQLCTQPPIPNFAQLWRQVSFNCFGLRRKNSQSEKMTFKPTESERACHVSESPLGVTSAIFPHRFAPKNYGPRSGGSSGPNPVLFGPVPRTQWSLNFPHLNRTPLRSSSLAGGQRRWLPLCPELKSQRRHRESFSCLISQVQGDFFSGLGTTQELKGVEDRPGERSNRGCLFEQMTGG